MVLTNIILEFTTNRGEHQHISIQDDRYGDGVIYINIEGFPVALYDGSIIQTDKQYETLGSGTIKAIEKALILYEI